MVSKRLPSLCVESITDLEGFDGFKGLTCTILKGDLVCPVGCAGAVWIKLMSEKPDLFIKLGFVGLKEELIAELLEF